MTRTFNRLGFTLVEALVVIVIIALLAALLLPALAKSLESGRQSACLSNLHQLYVANLSYVGDRESFVPASPDIYGNNLIRWYGSRVDQSSLFDSSTGPLSAYLENCRSVRTCASMSPWHFVIDPTVAYEAGCGGYGYNYMGIGSENYILGETEPASHLGMRPEMLTRPSTTMMFSDTAFPQYNGQSFLIEYSFAEPDQHLNSSAQLSGTATPSIHFRHLNRANVVWCDGHADSQSMTHSDNMGSQNFLVGWFGTQTNNYYFAPF